MFNDIPINRSVALTGQVIARKRIIASSSRIGMRAPRQNEANAPDWSLAFSERRSV